MKKEQTVKDWGKRYLQERNTKVIEESSKKNKYKTLSDEQAFLKAEDIFYKERSAKASSVLLGVLLIIIPTTGLLMRTLSPMYIYVLYGIIGLLGILLLYARTAYKTLRKPFSSLTDEEKKEILSLKKTCRLEKV